jgi:hypothetical protein
MFEFKMVMSTDRSISKLDRCKHFHVAMQTWNANANVCDSWVLEGPRLVKHKRTRSQFRMMLRQKKIPNQLTISIDYKSTL